MGKGNIRVIVPEELYFGGDTIHGVVELDVHKPIKNRGVRFLFTAYERTFWSEGQNNTHSEKRVFLNLRRDLTGAPRAERKHAPVENIEPGKYHWPFAVELPALTPPSCIFPEGRIAYVVIAYVDIPMRRDIKFQKVVRVGGNLFDQIAYTLPTMPMHSTNEKKFLFRRGKLHVEATIPKFHFFPGEIADVTVEINNGSKKAVDAIKISLVTSVRFYAHRSSTSRVAVKYKRTHDIKIPGKTNRVCNFQYLLSYNETPTTAMSVLNVQYAPRLVKVYHYIRVRLDVSWAIDLKVDIPITLMNKNPHAPMYEVITAPPEYYPEKAELNPALESLADFPGSSYPSYPPSTSYGPPLSSDILPPSSYLSNPPSTPSYPPNDAIYQHPPLMNPIQQQAPFSAYVVPPPTQQPLYPPNNFVSLQKQTDPHPPFDSTLSEHPPTSPPLPQPPYIHPQGVEPITPSLRQPYYPVLEGYQYPTDMSATLLSFGDHHLDEEEDQLLS